MKKIFTLFCFVFFAADLLNAQEAAPVENPLPNAHKKRYTEAGTVELAGSFVFTSYTVSTKIGSSSVTSNSNQLALSPSVAVFPVHMLSLGIAGEIVTNSGGSKSYGAYFTPGFVFDLNTIIYPYVRGHIGFASLSYGNIGGSGISQSGVGYGGRVGIKFALAEHAMMDLGIQYSIQNYSETKSGVFTVYGYSNNVFSSSVGFSVWF